MAETSGTPALKNWFEQLPAGAEYHPAPARQFQETILLVPFHGGHRPQLRRHVEFLNQLGFDVVDFEFDLQFSAIYNFAFSAQRGLGFKHVWADQIEGLMNSIPGRKIVYAFSNPASGAIEALARRHATDISALICDSGPTAHFWESIVQYFRHETPIPVAPARWALASLLTPLWSLNARNTLHEDLSIFPDGFPILSIRGWKDSLIPPKHIDEVFEPHGQIEWQKLSLPEAEHLNGLRDFAEEYSPPVTRFLHQHASRL